jgi:hypothetical protein
VRLLEIIISVKEKRDGEKSIAEEKFLGKKKIIATSMKV